MSYKTSLIKMAIKWTPKTLILWAVNRKLKGIAELTDFIFDIETRKSYAQIKLFGEAEPIEVWLEDFAIVSAEGAHSFIIRKAQSNRPWLDNLLSRITGTAWKIPAMLQIELINELFKPEPEPEHEEN